MPLRTAIVGDRMALTMPLSTLLFALLLQAVAADTLPAQASATDVAPGPETFDTRVVATGLENPWQMRMGPDGFLWVTERTGKRVVRVNPVDGSRQVAVEIRDATQRHTQDGVLGLALDPELLRTPGRNHVYVALTYDGTPGAVETRRLTIRRYTYDPASGTLADAVDIISGLPAGVDHIGGRLAFGHDGKLYLTIGDQGLNQLSLYCQPIHAQDLPTAAEVAAGDWHAYVGKVLRLELDGSIPVDNPRLGDVQSHVFSYGHRNPQGLAVAPSGAIYASEHGPSMDDELNLIRAGGNYGWPFVAGYQDDRVYVYANWSASSPEPCASLQWDDIVAPPSVPQQTERSWSSPDFVPPIRTFFTVNDTYQFKQQGNATIAPSGVDVYAMNGGIPGWADSVLVTGLIRGAIYRVKLGSDGRSTTGPSLEYFKGERRYRDVLVGDEHTIYLATDNNSKQNPGAILAFTYRSTPVR